MIVRPRAVPPNNSGQRPHHGQRVQRGAGSRDGSLRASPLISPSHVSLRARGSHPSSPLQQRSRAWIAAVTPAVARQPSLQQRLGAPSTGKQPPLLQQALQRVQRGGGLGKRHHQLPHGRQVALADELAPHLVHLT